MNTRFHRPLHPPHLAQRVEHDVSRQQQQDNGTHEFQPTPQHGDGAGHDDRPHTLEAYLQRARQLGDLPVARPTNAEPPRRADLRLAK